MVNVFHSKDNSGTPFAISDNVFSLNTPKFNDLLYIIYASKFTIKYITGTIFRPISSITRRLPHMKQELFTIPEHLCPSPDVVGFVLFHLQFYGYALQTVVGSFVLFPFEHCIELSVLFRHTASDYSLGIFKRFSRPLHLGLCKRYYLNQAALRTTRIPIVRQRSQPDTHLTCNKSLKIPMRIRKSKKNRQQKKKNKKTKGQTTIYKTYT